MTATRKKWKITIPHDPHALPDFVLMAIEDVLWKQVTTSDLADIKNCLHERVDIVLDFDENFEQAEHYLHELRKLGITTHIRPR